MAKETREFSDRNGTEIIPNILIDENGVAEDTNAYNANAINEKLKLKKVDGNEYLQFNSSTIYTFDAYKINNIVFIYFDVSQNMVVGQNIVGKVKAKLLISSFGAARVGNGSTAFVATILALSEGDIRVHSTSTGIGFTGSIILLLDE